MIVSLDIRDLGVISEASLPLGPGLTVVTGETGAGKTMVVTALCLLLGQRADTARVRSGAEASWVEGHFSVAGVPEVADRVDEVGGDIDDGHLVVARQVATEGRSRVVVGGRSAPLAVLQDIAEHLVVVHGQSDQVRLRSESEQRAVLDRFAGAELASLLTRYGALYSQHREWLAELESLEHNSETFEREAEDLREALHHIERVRPVAGEDEGLKALSARLQHTEELRLAGQMARTALSADHGGLDTLDATSLLDQALKALERVVDRDSRLAPILSALQDASYQVSEVGVALSGYLDGLDTDQGEDLESVMQRVAEITELCRRYGPTLDDVLTFEKTASDRLLLVDQSGDRQQGLRQKIEETAETLDQLSLEIRTLRLDAASALEARVTEELHALAMPDARLVVSVEDRGSLTQSGRDQVSFLLAPHSGAEPRPLGKGASGGELSRVMLALEVVIAGVDPVPTFIFDEVDQGVGGASALEIGRRLQALAENSQVIVVTHLPQVACFAGQHVLVEKDRTGEFTRSSVRVLDREERVLELARMLGGDATSDSAVVHAREMLERWSVSR